MSVSVGLLAVACVPSWTSDDFGWGGIHSALARVAADLVHRKSDAEIFVSGSLRSASCASSVTAPTSETYAVGLAREVISVPADVRRGGYGLFPFSMLWDPEAFTTRRRSHISVETLVISQGQTSWVFISVPVVGLTFATVRLVEEAVRGVTHADERAAKVIADDSNCTLVTVSATHTHTAPDSIGLWGGSSSQLLWWKAQKEHRQVFVEPLVRAAGAGARRAFANLRPVRVHLRQGTLATTALKRKGGKAAQVGHADGLSMFDPAGSHRSGVENSHILRLGDVASFWVADAHAATSLGRGGSGAAGLLGDYPQYISEDLKRVSAQAAPLVYAPGLIGRSYPDEQDNWPESWVESVRRWVEQRTSDLTSVVGEQIHPTLIRATVSEGGLAFKQFDLCARPTSRLFPVIEFWSQLWSGDEGQDPCESLLPGRRTVRLQLVQIAGVDFVLAPFELFPHAAASLARLLKGFDPHFSQDIQNKLREADGDVAPGPIVFVSLANGFLGYAADSRVDDAGPYHRILALFNPLPERP